MRIVLTYLLLMTLFSAKAQDKAQKIVKEYSRGEGPTYLNDGLGDLNIETHYDKKGREIKMIRFRGHGYKSSETITSYNRESKPKTITKIDYPKGFWPGKISSKNHSADHPNIKPDTTGQQYIYEDTLLLRIDYFKNGKLSTWVEYTYNEDGYEIESVDFNGSRKYRGRWMKTTRDKYNHPIKSQELYSDSSVKLTETRTYDTDGLVKMKDFTSRYLTLHAVTKMTYESNGLITKEVQETLSPEDRKGVIDKRFAYNARGLLIKEGRLDSLGKVNWEKVHEYNSSRQKIKTQFKEFAYHYKYNKKGDLISSWLEDSRSEVESARRFVYEKGLLQKTEHYNRVELTSYTQNFYSESGILIRQEPMPVEGKEELDWIKYFNYDEKGQLIGINYKRPDNNVYYQGINPIYDGSQRPQQKPDPYKNYFHNYTYFTYDKKGRLENEYYQGGAMTRISRLEDGKFGIYQHDRDAFGMQLRSAQMLDRLDTISIETRGELKIITLALDYLGSSNRGKFESMTHYHKNLKREETFNEKGEMIGLKEITEDGILLFSSDENETKTLSTHNRYIRSKTELFRYGRYSFDKVSITLYNSDNLEYKVTHIGNDTTEFIYENGQLSREIRKHSSGYYSLTTYDYDKNGLKTMERIFKEDGTETYRRLYENDGKHIISKQSIYVRPNREILYEITYY